MEMGHIVLIITTFMTGVFGWVANSISNKPKSDENKYNQIELIFTQYEKLNEALEHRNVVLVKENRELRIKIETLEEKIRRLERGEKNE